MDKRRQSRQHRARLARLVALLGALALLWTLASLSALRGTWLANSTDRERTLPQADVAIVLGAMVWGLEPSPAFAERLDYAAGLFTSGNVQRIIVTGGLDAGGTITEAESGARYLERYHHIPRNHIALEETSTSTAENLWNARAVMLSQGWETAVVVTHGYHLHRALLQAQAVGLNVAGGLGVETRVMFLPPLVLREVLALAAHWAWERWLLKGFPLWAVVLADLTAGALLLVSLLKIADYLPLPGSRRPPGPLYRPPGRRD